MKVVKQFRSHQAETAAKNSPAHQSLRSMLAFDTDHFSLPLPDGHRFPMAKYRLLRERIINAGLPVQLCQPPAATDAQLTHVHTPDYIQRVAEGRLSDVEIRRIGFPWSPEMVERSRRSSGATVAAASQALEDGVACNLAGGTHHAGPDRGQGYCVFNDAAVAIAELLVTGRIGTAAVIDTDVHQGNGTAEIFANNNQVFTLSIHGERNFPARKCASDIDIALPPGTSDDVYLAELTAGLDKLFAACQPQIAVFTSGADPYVNDTLGSLALSKTGLRTRDQLVFETCQRLNVPVALTMAGGYSNDVDDIVDIHFATVCEALKFHSRWASQIDSNEPIKAELP